MDMPPVSPFSVHVLSAIAVKEVQAGQLAQGGVLEVSCYAGLEGSASEA